MGLASWSARATILIKKKKQTKPKRVKIREQGEKYLRNVIYISLKINLQ